MTFEKTPEGTPRTWGALLDQGKWWRTSGGGWMLVVDMDPKHRANTVRWLLRRAAALADRMGHEELGLFHDAPDEVVDGWLREDEARMVNPQGWLSKTVLVRALSAGLQVDADLNEALADQARRDADLLALDEVVRERIVEQVEQVPAAAPAGRRRDARGRFARDDVARPLTYATEPGEHAIREVLAALDAYIDGQKSNHEACGHRGEDRGSECWVTWHPDDFRRMVADAAREIGRRDVADEVEARIAAGWDA